MPWSPPRQLPQSPTCTATPPHHDGRRRFTHDIEPLVHGHGHLRPQGLRQHKHVPRYRVIWPGEENRAGSSLGHGRDRLTMTHYRQKRSKKRLVMMYLCGASSNLRHTAAGGRTSQLSAEATAGPETLPNRGARSVPVTHRAPPPPPKSVRRSKSLRLQPRSCVNLSTDPPRFWGRKTSSPGLSFAST